MSWLVLILPFFLWIGLKEGVYRVDFSIFVIVLVKGGIGDVRKEGRKGFVRYWVEWLGKGGVWNGLEWNGMEGG